MKIRFLRTTPSAVPAYPFQAGQIIEVEKLTEEMRAWLKPAADGTVLAELIGAEPELAIVGVAEHAVVRGSKRAKGR